MSEQTLCQKLFFVLKRVMYDSTLSQKLSCSSSAIGFPSGSLSGDSVADASEAGFFGSDCVEEMLMISQGVDPIF
jgi:hypothetical protein